MAERDSEGVGREQMAKVDRLLKKLNKRVQILRNRQVYSHAVFFLPLEDRRVPFKMIPIINSLLLRKIQRESYVNINQKMWTIPAQIKLDVTLHFLATGDSLSSIENSHGVLEIMSSQFIPEVLDAIYSTLSNYIKVPNSKNEWKQIENTFKKKWYFPGCIGAIEGRNVVINDPTSESSGNNLIMKQLIVVVDGNHCFRYVEIGQKYDDVAFDRCALKQMIEQNELHIPENFVFLGNETFPLKPYLMTPYPREGSIFIHEVFNNRLLRAKSTADNAIGVLCSQFRILEKPINTTESLAIKIVKTACALHNWLRINCDPGYFIPGIVDTEKLKDFPFTCGFWRMGPVSEGLTKLNDLPQRFAHANDQKTRDLRNHFRDLFMATGGENPWRRNTVH